MAKVFLSYSSKDRADAQKLSDLLREKGVDVWIDQLEIRVGDSLTEKIGEAIKDADFILVMPSHNSVASDWVKKELALAMTKELADRTVRVLPIMLEPCEIPPFLTDKFYADFTTAEQSESSLKRLLETLGAKTEVVVPLQPVTMKAHAQPMRVRRVGSDSGLPPEQARLERFEDIRILGIDEEKLYKPDPNSQLYHIYFELSGEPPQEWIRAFEAERKFPRHTMWRRAWIEGKYIVVYCVPDEVARYHLRDIKEDVGTCNSKYRDDLARQAAMRARTEQEGSRVRDELRRSLGGLDFS